jgi:hypothetical protein
MAAVYVGAVGVPAAAVLAMGKFGGGALFVVLALMCLAAAGLTMAAAARTRALPG